MGTTTRLTSAVVAPLLERDDALVVLHSSLSEVRSGVGRMLLVSGEAGIGKTALVRSFTASVRGSARVLEGACDALAAPRPLGAFVDIGGGSGDRLRELVAQDPSPHEVFEALSEELAGPPSVLVVEDVHWADEATLDVLRVLGRRIEGVDALVILTYRDDAVGPVHPVRMLLGDLAHRAGRSDGSRWSRCSPGRRRDGGRVRAGRGRAPPADRRQPVLRARGAGGGRRPGAGDGGRGGATPAPRG